MLLRVDFKPLSPFKSFPESYTIFGAICWGIRILFGEDMLNDLLEEFKENPPFLISSPILKLKDAVYFPKPVLCSGDIEIQTYKDYEMFKKVKETKYITQEAFKEILDGKIKTREELARYVEANGNKMFTELNIPHASINRITWTTAGGELYNEPVYYFGVSFSIFILVFNKERLNLIESALKITSIGGNKSTGMGYADVSFEEENGWIKEYIVSRTERFVSLSPHFYDEAFDIDKSYYEPYPFVGAVENFYGRITPSIWKRRFLYMGKGSNISISKFKDFYGLMKVAYEDRNTGACIYQYGYAFPLYVREER